MNETGITFYIHDLDISDKSRRFLTHAGIIRLDDFLNLDINGLYAMSGINEDVLQELGGVLSHAEDINNYFEKRAKRINELVPKYELMPIELIGFSVRSRHALKRGGISTVADLIQMSKKDIVELRGVGDLSQKEIISTIESIVQCGSIGLQYSIDSPFLFTQTVTYAEAVQKKERLERVLPEVGSIPIDDIPFSTRAHNALEKADIQTVGALLTMSERDILNLHAVGEQTRYEITSIIKSILENGKGYFEKLAKSSYAYQEAGTEIELRQGKGFDYSTIDILTAMFGLKPAEMAELFGLSRQRIYSILEKRSSRQRTSWTGKDLSEREKEILTGLIENNRFDYTDDEVICSCMNNKRDDFVCLFIYDNEIKCFFLKDLPDTIQDIIIHKKMHIYTERELAGESAGHTVYLLTKPYFRSDDPGKFRANAQLRGMTTDEYSVFISGYHYLDQRSITDDQIIAFMKENLVDGEVYISADPKNQWIKTIASRNGYKIKDFIELYGFKSKLDGKLSSTDAAKERHREELKKLVVSDNVVYIPANSYLYKQLQTYAYNLGIDMNSYIHSLGFERTTVRPSITTDSLEEDMEVRQSDGSFEERVFAMYPLIGSMILKPGTLEKLNANARKYIDQVLMEPKTKLPLRAEMQVAIALINNAKNWKSEENGNFWNYITLQFGYRDTNGSVVRLLQSSLEKAMKQNRRLFFEDANGREFKSTAVIHALSTRKSWMALFDFLFDFYKSNLNWQIIPDDPLIAVMVHALQQKLSGGNEEETELTISSKAYSFQEGIRKLVLYRPVFTRGLFEKLIDRINSLVNNDAKPVKTYEELLCEDWFKEKITAIANTKKTERQSQRSQREIAIDYSRIHLKYILNDETDVQLVLPDIRLKNEDIQNATFIVTCNGSNLITQKLSWYGNELGKTLNGISISLPAISVYEDGMNVQAQIICDQTVIYDSEKSLNRNVFLFYGEKEIAVNQIKRDRYTLVVPADATVETENIDVVEVDAINNRGLKAYFLELRDGYMITVDDRLIAFDNNNGNDIRIIAPSESTILPLVTLNNTEACLAYRNSSCKIVLGNRDYIQQYILLKDGEKIEFSSLQQSDSGLIFTLPFNEGKDKLRMQVISLADERLIYDKTFMLITEADCCFNREFYYAASDYKDAEYYADIDDFREVIPFTKEDTEVRIPFRDGELHVDIPKVVIQETSGAWLQEVQPAWYVGLIPQASFLKVTKPATVDVRFLIGGKDIMYDGQGLVSIGNVLQSFISTNSFINADIEMQAIGQQQKDSYPLANVFFKERFLRNPSFWFDDNKLFWDHGGVFIGNPGREFTLHLAGSGENDFEFILNENTECISLPEDIPIGNYSYEISIQTGGLFKRTKEVVATGDCIIGDKNLLRFMNRKIIIDSITDEFMEDAGHIPIRPCYIDQIRFCGMEDTSEGYCPVYSGVIYTDGYYGERYEFSFDVHTNKKGVTKMMVNPVRIVCISDSSLCITDADGDGLYYYSYYDKSLGDVVYALTDHEYTKANKHKYSNADLYSYRTERI